MEKVGHLKQTNDTYLRRQDLHSGPFAILSTWRPCYPKLSALVFWNKNNNSNITATNTLPPIHTNGSTPLSLANSEDFFWLILVTVALVYCKWLFMLENCLCGKYSAAQLLTLVLYLFLAKLEAIDLIELFRFKSEIVVLLSTGIMLRYGYTSPNHRQKQ